jgi:AraC-like DNA-binding protein
MEVYKRKLNREIIQQILDSFVELTGIRAAYFDITETNHWGAESHHASGDHLGNTVNKSIVGKNKPLCTFCESLRELKQQEANCIRCDKTAFKIAEETAKPYIYKCHMGLYEAVIPIFIKARLTGCLMLGQVASTEELQSQLKELEEKLLSLDIDPGKRIALSAAFQATAVMSRSKIEAAAKMLDIIAQHIINTDVIYVYDMDSIEKAKHYMGQHFKEPLSVADIAGFTCLSPSYLSFLFKRETGFTITRYIDRLRIDNAKESLVMTSKSVKEISFLLGYADQNYFSRTFKKHEGISPVEYRAKNKKLC